jgi:hypothetical protein
MLRLMRALVPASKVQRPKTRIETAERDDSNQEVIHGLAKAGPLSDNVRHFISAHRCTKLPLANTLQATGAEDKPCWETS